jgi:hypothetical protein
MPAQTVAMPMAAPMPSNHQAAIAAYDRVVGAKPPFAYESAKTAAATPNPTAASRRKLCFPLTKPRSTASYSSAVLGGLRRLLVVGFVAGVLLSAPTAAFACGGSNPSAVNVYVECLQDGGGSKPTNHSSSPSTTPVVPSKTARLLAHAGHDKALLSKWAGSPGPSGLESTGPASSSSAIGSAFDLGSGPTALLIILAGTAVALLGGSGLRFWRRRSQQI